MADKTVKLKAGQFNTIKAGIESVTTELQEVRQNQEIIIQKYDTCIFMLQAVAVTVCFIWGCKLWETIRSAKSSKNLW